MPKALLFKTQHVTSFSATLGVISALNLNFKYLPIFGIFG